MASSNTRDLLQDWTTTLVDRSLSKHLTGLHGSDGAFTFSLLQRSTGGLYWLLCRNNREAERLVSDLSFFTEANLPVVLIPGIEADPYSGLSPHPAISEQRAVGLWKLLQLQAGFVVTTLHSVLSRVPSPQEFMSTCLHLEVGGFFPLDHLLLVLRRSGYLREDPVSETGEFSHRGGIVDIFPPSYQNPVRIEFFGDEIESIREFDPSSQRSIQLLTDCQIIPMREFVPAEHDARRWQDASAEFWGEVRFAEALQEKWQFTEHGELYNGFEYLMPLVRPLGSTLFDYLGWEDRRPRAILLDPEKLTEEAAARAHRLSQRFEERHQDGFLALPPRHLFVGWSEITKKLEQSETCQVHSLVVDDPSTPTFDFRVERKYHNNFRDLLKDQATWRQSGERALFVMSTLGKAERLLDILKEYDVLAHFSREGFSSTLASPLAITVGNLSQGFSSRRLGLHVLTDSNVFDETVQRASQARKPAKRDLTSPFLSDFRDLREGDCVVHVEHGIGRFRGLKRIGVAESEKEFVELVYRNDAKLYVPVDRLDLLQKFSGAGDSSPTLDRLGGTSWEKTKRRIKKSIRDLAEDLLKFYAKRELARGHAFSSDDALMAGVEDTFPYEVTPDQAQAIEDVKRDMESERPMDRLVCGDVGYGKTEVAMRAAFKAINDGYQVAILAPTTVLAFQHLTTFRERFEAFPVNVAMVSRFLNRKEQAEVLERAELGLTDILIGTHRLLSRDVHFNKLGLIVVDEEQRFGVSQKERLKKLKTEVDVLTLSATPIPRTLNMSMIGLRDLSIIETPPQDRLAIQTVVVRFSRDIIGSAIDLELKRKGQIFFVHNSIETIDSIAAMIQETAPDARVCVAHGQMPEQNLEQVMLRFLAYEYDVLVCTTIIENGLDIPRANTLIVNRADHFGLSQLYQLRGRVGRSNRRAYAYLLVPSQEVLTEQARKRLQAIREFSDLGAGFRIAALDLEIRGTGNLLGAEQHGHISQVGLDLYMSLLEHAVRELRGESPLSEVHTSIDLGLDIQIPEHYITDSRLRLRLYKRISAVSDSNTLEALKAETTDRFGKYPRAVSNLFRYTQLRLQAQHLRVLSIERQGRRVGLKFQNDTPIPVNGLISMVGREKGLSMSPDGRLLIDLESTTPAGILANLTEKLTKLAVIE